MRIFVVIVFLIGSLTLTAQQEEIQKDFEDYLELIQSQQFDEAMDYMYPEFFDLMSREMMVTLMEQAYNIPELSVTYSLPVFDSIGTVEYLDSMYFSQINYTYYMYMNFNSHQGELNQDIEMMDESAFETLKILFGKDNVTYDSISKKMQITSHKLVYARSEDGEDEWKFIELDPENMYMIKSMIPEELYNRAINQSR